MAEHAPLSSLTWIGSDRRLVRVVARPMLRFLQIEAASGVLLILATIAALVWINSPFQSSYIDFWHSDIKLDIAGFVLEEHLVGWVNDALMAVFFFVAGLEIKRELVGGELANPRVALLPGLAALGGMIVPAALFAIANLAGAGSSGWGIPMATDIAFAVGVLSLLGSRVPTQLKVFLLTLAVVDDIGAIIVIAIFYAQGVSFWWLALAAALLGLVVVMRRNHIWYQPLYVLVGLFVWLAVFKSGVHATVAGVALGLLTPARPLHADVVPPDEVLAPILDERSYSATEARRATFHIHEAVPVADRLVETLHPISSYVILPIFALANAGVVLSRSSVSSAVTSKVTLGVALGLVLGKFLGVSGATILATKLRIGELSPSITRRHLLGMACIAGVGFTVALFVTGLAFDDAVLQDEAKIGILVASVVAAALGSAILLGSKPVDDVRDRPSELSLVPHTLGDEPEELPLP